MSFRPIQKHKYDTEVISSDTEKLEKLQDILDGRISSIGKVFKPGTEFYKKDLHDMAEEILEWIGVDLGKDKVWLQYTNEIEEAGLYFYSPEEKTHYILVNIKHSAPNERAAVLAHELMHYILIGGCNFRLSSTLDNEKLTDMATVYTGLGVVVLNGFVHKSNNWLLTAGLFMVGFIRYKASSLTFGYYTGQDYGKLLAKYIDDFGILPGKYSGAILPSARHFLPTRLRFSAKRADNKTGYVLEMERLFKKAKIRDATIGGIVLIIGIIVLSSSNSNSSGQTAVQQQQSNTLDYQKSQLDALYSQVTACQSKIDQERPYVNDYDQSSVDNFNTEVNECNTLLGQYNTQRDSYNQAVNSYNSSLNQ